MKRRLKVLAVIGMAALGRRAALPSAAPWAKRSKLRSTTTTYNQPIENPGTTPGGLGRAGLGHGTVSPSAADLANVSASPK
jgi:hypothetical protein